MPIFTCCYCGLVAENQKEFPIICDSCRGKKELDPEYMKYGNCNFCKASGKDTLLEDVCGSDDNVLLCCRECANKQGYSRYFL